MPGREIRLKERKQKRSKVEAAQSLITLFNSSEHHDREGTDDAQESEESDDETDNNKSSQTDVTNSTLSAMETELNRLTAENITPKEKLAECVISEEIFKDDDEKVKLFTGLPSYAVLITLFNYIEPAVTHSHKSALSKFQKVSLVLMRLRLNLSKQYLADKLQVSQATISESLQKHSAYHVHQAPTFSILAHERRASNDNANEIPQVLWTESCCSNRLL